MTDANGRILLGRFVEGCVSPVDVGGASRRWQNDVNNTTTMTTTRARSPGRRSRGPFSPGSSTWPTWPCTRSTRTSASVTSASIARAASARRPPSPDTCATSAGRAIGTSVPTATPSPRARPTFIGT